MIVTWLPAPGAEVLTDPSLLDTGLKETVVEVPGKVSVKKTVTSVVTVEVMTAEFLGAVP